MGGAAPHLGAQRTARGDASCDSSASAEVLQRPYPPLSSTRRCYRLSLRRAVSNVVLYG
jgi:hypothetical protein